MKARYHVGQEVIYRVDDFDGSANMVSTVVEVEDDHIIISNSISDHLWIDEDCEDMVEVR